MRRDILFLCQFFYPEHNSSATLPFDTASYLAHHGFTVDALCGYPKEYSDGQAVPLREVQDGVEIQRLRYIQLGRVSTLGRLINYFSFTASALLHVGKLKKYKAVIVYSNPPILPLVPVLANILFRTKIVFVAYDVYPEIAYASNSLRSGCLIDRAMKWLNHKLYRRVSRVVALTDEMKEFLLAHRPELTEDKVTVIPNWAHEKRTAEPTPEAYKKFGFEPGQFIVSYFGNMGTCQEMETLLGAMRQLKKNPEIQFLFVGHGNKKPHVEEAAKETGNAKVYDFLTEDAFEQAIAISSCCVVSLEKGLQGMCAPSKYYSYLQAGRPVLAIVEEKSYLAKEVEGKENGCFIPIGKTEKLMETLDRLRPDKEKVKKMGYRSKELYLKKYDYKIGMKKYDSLFNELVTQK